MLNVCQHPFPFKPHDATLEKDIHGKQIEQILVYVPKFFRLNSNTSLYPRSNEDDEISNRNSSLLPN